MPYRDNSAAVIRSHPDTNHAGTCAATGTINDSDCLLLAQENVVCHNYSAARLEKAYLCAEGDTMVLCLRTDMADIGQISGTCGPGPWDGETDNTLNIDRNSDRHARASSTQVPLPSYLHTSFTVWMWQHKMSLRRCSQLQGVGGASQKLLQYCVFPVPAEA